jgi:sugar lactone lactonase YvrE
MRQTRLTGFIFATAIAVTAAMPACAQPSPPPSIDLPNPYAPATMFGQLPAGRSWGGTTAVAVDHDGKSVWVFERCGGESCADSKLPPILHFDPTGKLLASFAAGMFVFPHGIATDNDGNVWVADADGKNGKGQQVVKFSPTGKVLLTLGKAGMPGDAPGYFNRPSGVAIARNGDIFVSEGHTSTTGSARITKFDKNGKFILQWGKHGSGPGEFEVPHALCFDSKGRLFVGDRGNSRVQVFDQNGKFIEEFTQFGKPSGIYIDKHDILYVADSESQEVAGARGPYGLHPGWLRGIRLGSIKDGVVTAFIPDTETTGAKEPRPITTAAEGIVADSKGMLYGAEVGKMDIKKYVKQ